MIIEKTGPEILAKKLRTYHYPYGARNIRINVLIMTDLGSG